MSKTGIALKLVGEDGDAFSILGRAQKALRNGGLSDLVSQYHDEATSGDYNHLLVTTMDWFDCDSSKDEESDELWGDDEELCTSCDWNPAETEDGLCNSCYDEDNEW